MPQPDLNLLKTLEVLLAEGSVVLAAKRLRLSASAMSRALARLRKTMNDPLLVRAGRGLVASPRAVELRARVSQLVREAESVLRPAEALELSQLVRTFTVRTSDGFVENFGPALIARIAREAPLLRLRFMHKADKESTLLRNGTVDLETGVIGETASPEVLAQTLFQDRFIGVVRRRHPLTGGRMTLTRCASGTHISIARQGGERGLVDQALAPLGLQREIGAIVGGFAAALALARGSDLVATVPERHTENLRASMHSFCLPFPAPQVTVSMLWHPRLEADPAHRWLRGQVRAVCVGQRSHRKPAECG